MKDSHLVGVYSGEVYKILNPGNAVVKVTSSRRDGSFVNNLVEHCNCKVLILADEKIIGKIYANTNIERKYLTVLSGNLITMGEYELSKGRT